MRPLPPLNAYLLRLNVSLRHGTLRLWISRLAVAEFVAIGQCPGNSVSSRSTVAPVATNAITESRAVSQSAGSVSSFTRAWVHRSRPVPFVFIKMKCETVMFNIGISRRFFIILKKFL